MSINISGLKGPTQTVKNGQSLDLKKFLPYRISVLEQQISKTIAQQYTSRFNLSRMEWRVMSTLAMFDGITAKDICLFTHMEKMQVSRAINGMVEKKFVSQQVSHHDQRKNLLTLTAEGSKTYHQIVPLVLQEEKQIFKTLSDQELQLFHQLIHKLCLSLEPEKNSV